MKNKKIALHILVFTLMVSSFIACDKDFTRLESDIINDDIATNFDIENDTYDIITYTEPLGPVQTNNDFGINTLGIYDDSYGRVTSSFVLQPILSTFDPEFGEDVQLDSVVLSIPYQFRVTEIDEDNNITYEIDSVIGREPIKLSLYESNYFIRNFDPNEDFNESQTYYSNKSASESELISDAILEAEELTILPNPDPDDEDPDVDNFISVDTQGNLTINEEGYILRGPEPDDGGERSIVRQPPGIRVKLDTTYWRDKIIDKEGETVLSSANNFVEYFRGLYFKAEADDTNDGSFLILSTGAQNSNITIYYSRLTLTTTDDDTERENATFSIGLNGNGIGFMDNNFTAPINEGNAETGDSRIYLKGGEGAVGNIKLFNGDDLNDGDDNTFDDWKNTFVETNDDGEFVRSKRLVNEANLVFYVDQVALQSMPEGGEPDRVFLYDVENKRPLVDYFLDGINNNVPSFSVSNHLEPLQRVDDEPDGNGIKYKLRITEHINNLLVRDSTNVKLGLAVSLNVNLEESVLQRKVQSMDDIDFTVPISTILTPRGTVLHGNTTEDENKRVYLEIYYTEPND
jgi:hypothetical protein